MKKVAQCIRILIADDHEIVRCGLKSLLDQENDIEVIGESSSCEETLRLASILAPDLILLDLTLSDGNCIDSISELIQLCPASKILLFTALASKETHLLALRQGASGVLLKGDSYSAELLCKAIRQVFLNDKLWIDDSLTVEMLKQNVLLSQSLDVNASSSANTDKSVSVDKPLSPNKLTPRENQIACFSAKGMPAKLIGEKLFISEKTVRNQLTIIYSKLNVKNQLELAFKSNLVDLIDE